MTVLFGLQDRKIGPGDVVDWTTNKFGGIPVSIYIYIYSLKMLQIY